MKGTGEIHGGQLAGGNVGREALRPQVDEAAAPAQQLLQLGRTGAAHREGERTQGTGNGTRDKGHRDQGCEHGTG